MGPELRNDMGDRVFQALEDHFDVRKAGEADRC